MRMTHPSLGEKRFGTFQLAASLEPVEVRPGAAICMLTAALVSRDNKYVLKVSCFRFTLFKKQSMPKRFS